MEWPLTKAHAENNATSRSSVPSSGALLSFIDGAAAFVIDSRCVFVHRFGRAKKEFYDTLMMSSRSRGLPSKF